MTPPRTYHPVAIAHRRRRGIFLADVLTATAIVAALAVSMFVLLARANRVAQRMAGSRAANRAVESLLADLQSGRPPLPSSGEMVAVHPEPGGAAVPGYAWVRVTATVGGESADLLGLVPDGPNLHRALEVSATTRPDSIRSKSPAVSRSNPPATKEAP